jgi:hypothetical protein
VKLELRYLFGAPQAWQFHGHDAQLLRGLLQDIADHTVSDDKQSAILAAIDDNGDTIGAWNREGASALAQVIKNDMPGPRWGIVWQAIADRVTGP